MTAQAASRELISVADYLEWEEAAPRKHEYLGGVVYAMAGATNAHNKIATNALVALGAQLRGKPCRAYKSDTKVRIALSTHTRFYYPDVMVVCQRSAPELHFQDSPAVIIEVLSESTRRTDEQEKRDAYLTIPSLRAYLLLEHQAAAVTVWQRGEHGFNPERYEGPQTTVPLLDIGAELRLAEVYEGVTFPPPASPEEWSERRTGIPFLRRYRFTSATVYSPKWKMLAARTASA